MSHPLEVKNAILLGKPIFKILNTYRDLDKERCLQSMGFENLNPQNKLFKKKNANSFCSKFKKVFCHRKP